MEQCLIFVAIEIEATLVAPFGLPQSLELEKQGEVHQKTYNRPHHNRSKGVFHRFLEVTTNAVMSL